MTRIQALEEKKQALEAELANIQQRIDDYRNGNSEILYHMDPTPQWQHEIESLTEQISTIAAEIGELKKQLAASGGDTDSTETPPEDPFPEPSEIPTLPTTIETPTPEILEKLLKGSGEEPSPVEAALLLGNDMTEAQLRKAVRSDAYWQSGHPDRPAVQDAVAKWFSNAYGDDPQKLDFTGKPVRPDFKNPPPARPVQALSADGEDLDRALGGLARTLGHATGGAGKPGARAATELLQRGLNLARDPARDPPLKLDGMLGPKTRLAAKRAVMHTGRRKVEEAAALGGFEKLAEDAAQSAGGAVGVGTGRGDEGRPVIGSFKNLFPKDDRRAEGLITESVQDSINGLADEGFGPTGFQKLKLDGRFGPKTAGAFKTMAKAAGPNLFTRKVGHTFGFLNR